ncbi:carbon-nitrogen hydrolase family protein [Herbaspirillum seropedicae]|uniref:Nitrilase protein n=1 Tax=Herbaspirillum seropedicae (strain SmR1) TaxID=757424 RepID=D8IPB8_HERSS|nr:carbon-nitrogen hydrolase family protein [Herbaspirillum seropedicae]ADJ62938.1 nitrilase protein [Herbaspirillum seropedicae SmR1]AKN65026.1 acyltransferase [Herbaspirillum seropedicae]NQE31176.1 acyltransferase [Herbaspirillum seropedicae]UMU20974.1 carbon-nitrogen hydrolase family protein [Herbaspirillum seropedicae]
MTQAIKVAAIQMVSTPEVAENFASATRLVAAAAQQGAQLVLLPEYWPIMGRHERDKLAHAEADGAGPIQECMASLARQHGLWLVGGTLPLKADNPDKVLNTSLVYGPQGQRVARYDKIHLFNFVRGEENYDEARTIEYGHEVQSFEAPFGRVGLSVCYDLRFPELYRAMGECALIVMPAAFTYTTGRAHWELLLRARAIENQCYVLASAQGGEHVNGRRTWGHSMLVDPWGEIVSVLPEGEGLVIGDIDPHRLQYVRESLPALRHRKL